MLEQMDRAKVESQAAEIESLKAQLCVLQHSADIVPQVNLKPQNPKP